MTGWPRERAVTVEECVSIRVRTIVDGGFDGDDRRVSILASSLPWRVDFQWVSDLRPEDTALVSLSYWFDLESGNKLPSFRLAFAGGQWRPRQLECFSSVRLVTTKPHFGGLRWWFECPFVDSSIVCRRRVGILYLKPGDRRIGCRQCHRLTYRSTQQHDPRVDAVLKHRRSVDEMAQSVSTRALHSLKVSLAHRDKMRSKSRRRGAVSQCRSSRGRSHT